MSYISNCNNYVSYKFAKHTNYIVDIVPYFSRQIFFSFAVLYFIAHNTNIDKTLLFFT